MFTLTPDIMKKLHTLPPGERGMEIERLKYEYQVALNQVHEPMNAVDMSVPLMEVNKTQITETDFSKT